jgi:hypothetical protein
MADLRIAVDPASPAGDYTARVEYRVLADGRVRLERVWIEPPREAICTCGSDCAPGPFHTLSCPSRTTPPLQESGPK